MRRTITIVVVLVLLVLAGVGLWLRSAAGFSARQEPTRLESVAARAARSMSVPSGAKNMSNPMPLTAERLEEARHHFADHCATCHANDGSGNTEMGQNLYPKAPDMRQQATQSKSDGELYFIIHNGIRLSGMPAWGPASGDDNDSWALVNFIRHLPQLSPEELADMKKYNPMSAMEMKEDQEEENFLNGNPAKK
ncbi:MAG TPA: c-type cytochrome [Candidatus Angelobacter sp.]|jgi:cytochrome c|nr:c-type cytochrome [Candidatus Angelobacter sp.]